MQNDSTGFCRCGCGKKTPLAAKTSKRDNTIKGMPVRFIKGHNNHKYTIEDRFWSKIIKSENPEKCWPWMAGHSRGYGIFNISKREPVGAHRMAWSLTYGEIPDGLCVCHHCDNRECCNPNHLFLGTISDNNKDMVAKGRCRSRGIPGRKIRTENLPKGETHHNAKLNNDLVKELREKFKIAPYGKKKALAEDHGIHYATLWRMCTNRGWKHII